MAKPQRLCFRAVEFRAVEGGDGRTLEGYGAMFEQPTRIDSWEGSFIETVARGAFTKTLSERKPVLQFDHGRDARTGSVPIGAIQEIREDDRGLFVSARLFDNHAVEPVRQAIEGGAIDGMSFRFRVNQDEWSDRDGNPVKESELSRLLHDAGERGPLHRSIREVELYEVGPVVFPAYESTSVGVRSLLSALGDEDREALLDELIERAAQAPKKKKPPMPVDEDDDDEEDDEDEGTPTKKKKAKAPAKKPTSTYDSGLSYDSRTRLLDLL